MLATHALIQFEICQESDEEEGKMRRIVQLLMDFEGFIRDKTRIKVGCLIRLIRILTISRAQALIRRKTTALKTKTLQGKHPAQIRSFVNSAVWTATKVLARKEQRCECGQKTNHISNFM